MSRFFLVQMWDEVPLRTNTGQLHFFMHLILHFDRRSGMGSFFNGVDEG